MLGNLEKTDFEIYSINHNFIGSFVLIIVNIQSFFSDIFHHCILYHKVSSI